MSVMRRCVACAMFAAIAAFVLAGAGFADCHAGAATAHDVMAHQSPAHENLAQSHASHIHAEPAAASPDHGHGAPDKGGAAGGQNADAHCCASFAPPLPVAGLTALIAHPAAVLRPAASSGAPDAEARGLMRPPRPLHAV